MFPPPDESVRIVIAAGEPSGDLHAARLMAAIRKLVPTVVFEGIGGPAMELEGLRSMARLRDLAVSGFWEVAKRYGFFRTLLQRCGDRITQHPPALFLPVDYPGFNLRLASIARRARVPVAWYIAPQLWAWGKSRGPKLASSVNHLLAVFPFEPAFFQQFGIRTSYVGHPLLDDPAFSTVPSHKGHSLALFPGSRRQELLRHVPLLAEMVRLLPSDVASTVAVAPSVDSALIAPLIHVGVQPATDSRAVLAEAGAGLVKAGTSTLEAALMGLPFATFYRTSALSAALTRRLATIDHVTMANVLLNRPAVHEFLQQGARPQALAREAMMLLEDGDRRSQLHDFFDEVRSLLGGPGAAQRAAAIIAEMVQR